MKAKLIATAFASLVLFACNSTSEKTKTNVKTASVEAKEEKAEGKKIYGVKSGKLSYVTQVMGNAVTTEIYFDNYGQREETITRSESGIKMHKRVYIKDGYSYGIDLLEKSASRTKVPESLLQRKNKLGLSLLNLSNEEQKAYGLKEAGTAEVLGRTCKVYTSMAFNKENKNYVYNGIVLKAELGDEPTMEAISFEENIDMPDWFYKVPDDIKLEEFDIPEDALD